MVIGPGGSKGGHCARQEKEWSLGQAGVRVVIVPGRSKGGHWARQE